MKNLNRTPLDTMPISSIQSGSGSTLCLQGGSAYTFQYYDNKINSSKVQGWVTLENFIKANRDPKPHIVELFNQIAYYSSINDLVNKAALKEQLYSFTPCVHLAGVRRYEDIVKFTGLLVLDFDKISNAEDFKQYLFETYQCIIASWTSPSKKGVKALVKIPIVNSTNEFKEYFYGIAEEMWQYNGFDAAPQNCVLPLFQSLDRDLLYREDAVTWVSKGINLKSIYNTPPIPANPVQYSTNYEKIIISMINNGIDKITDNGHPQLRSLCLSIGGYVANNYIDHNIAIQQINYKIQNNSYLQKGIANYQKTALWAVNHGMNRPLTLNER